MTIMRPHASYKPSSAEWVGTLPGHWMEKPLFAVAQERRERNVGMRENNLLSLSYGRIVRKDINANGGLLPESFETYQIVEPGDVVFRMTDLQNDQRSLRSALCGERGIITSAYIAMTVAGCTPSFFSYLMRAYDVQKAFYSMGGGLRQSLKYDDLRRIPIPLPGAQEQEAIVAFLDRETRRIDQLVQKKVQLVALLQEKRSALITHVVTKGIVAAAETQETGIEWIGRIPASWELTKLGYLGRSANGINIGGDAFGSGYPFVSYGDVYRNRQLPEQVDGLVQSSDSDRASYSIKEGDVLFTRTSETIEEIAFPSVCVKTINDAVFAGFLIRFRPFEGRLLPSFSKFAFQNSGIRQFFVKEMKLVTRASLSQRLLQSLPIAVPPLVEQRAMAEFLEEQDQRFDRLIAKTKRSIELLKERRSALITSAVTGKIDVRNAA